jgi:hypothetical protein
MQEGVIPLLVYFGVLSKVISCISYLKGKNQHVLGTGQRFTMSLNASKMIFKA